MEQPDLTIHQPVRLKIVSALKVLPPKAMIEFVRLRALIGATEGNLATHLATLESAGYVQIVKDYDGKKPRTRIVLTNEGVRAFENYVAYLREIIDMSAKEAS